MPIDEGLAALVHEQLAPLGRISVRRMFGGAGVYADGLMFGLIADDRLFFKVAGTSVAASSVAASSMARYVAEGSEPFAFEARGRTIVMSYWRVPERLLDEPEELVAWARQALADAVVARGQSSRRGAKPGKGKAQSCMPGNGKRGSARSPRR